MNEQGRWIPLSPARKMVMEILHHARKVPSLPLSRMTDVARLADARQAGAAVSWTAIFMKAYGLVAQRHPALRQTYMPFPWPHLYEHPFSICTLMIEREHAGETILLPSKIRSPECQPLAAIDSHLRRLRETPIHDIGDFRQWLRVGRLPGFVRRFLFWHTLNLSGFKRAKRFGTFSISSLGSMGVEQHHPMSPLTTYFTFGPISAAGSVDVKLIYDHRVMDGRTVGRVLNDLEETLNTQILEELLELADEASDSRNQESRARTNLEFVGTDVQ